MSNIMILKFKIILILLFSFASSVFPQDQPYVILVSFDGFRWDYSEREITPNLSEMKKNGVHALSLQPSFPTKTFPNHLSIITGLYPQNHGIIFNSFTNPHNGEGYRLGDTISVRDSKWYLGEAFWETAERNGIKTASFFWPGSELKLDHRRPTYYKKYDHNKPYIDRIEGVINWLKLPPSERPHFITLYFDDTDTYGHKYGPNSDEVNESIKRLDGLIGELKSRLKDINLYDSTNIIIVSDHGMTEIDTNRVINIEDILKLYDVEYGGSKPVMMIKPASGKTQEVFSLLKENERHYKVYMKDDMPDHFHFNKHPFIYPIILVADIGWSLMTNDLS
ncbi:MAG: ectonucleotide pyrophosphatase/phosphodiesterase, partial [Melioribacteraceae bacterium]|nr:ectonucleotide pyrophosphatase/phosphodiesterase [Melioribacteraceae bacterium]